MNYIEKSAKTVDEAITEALIELGTTSDNVDIEVLEKGSSGIFGLFSSKLAKIRVTKKCNYEEVVTEFLESVFDAMNISARITVDYDESKSNLDIELKGNNMGILIGKRGQTLDSLQYLVSLVVNKVSDNYVRVKLDTENYRERRKETLETLAKNLSHKVKKTNKRIKLEPMNPYERRVIHSTLQNDKFISTFSEGDEPYRKVVITPKN